MLYIMERDQGDIVSTKRGGYKPSEMTLETAIMACMAATLSGYDSANVDNIVFKEGKDRRVLAVIDADMMASVPEEGFRACLKMFRTISKIAPHLSQREVIEGVIKVLEEKITFTKSRHLDRYEEMICRLATPFGNATSLSPERIEEGKKMMHKYVQEVVIGGMELTKIMLELEFATPGVIDFAIDPEEFSHKKIQTILLAHEAPGGLDVAAKYAELRLQKKDRIKAMQNYFDPLLAEMMVEHPIHDGDIGHYAKLFPNPKATTAGSAHCVGLRGGPPRKERNTDPNIVKQAAETNPVTVGICALVFFATGACNAYLSMRREGILGGKVHIV